MVFRATSFSPFFAFVFPPRRFSPAAKLQDHLETQVYVALGQAGFQLPVQLELGLRGVELRRLRRTLKRFSR